jgi:simple sugar transport system ATP-binding protein
MTMSVGTQARPMLELSGHKAFAGVKALTDVGLRLFPGKCIP